MKDTLPPRVVRWMPTVAATFGAALIFLPYLDGEVSLYYGFVLAPALLLALLLAADRLHAWRAAPPAMTSRRAAPPAMTSSLDQQPRGAAPASLATLAGEAAHPALPGVPAANEHCPRSAA